MITVSPRLAVGAPGKVTSAPVSEALLTMQSDHAPPATRRARASTSHRAAEGGELAARQAAPDAEAEAAVADMVEDRDLLGDAQRIVPQQDHRRGPEIGMAGDAGQVAHQLQVIGAERVVVEMVLDRPQHIETEFVGKPRQAQFLVPHLPIADAIPAIAGEDHLNPDIHRGSPSRCRPMLAQFQRPLKRRAKAPPRRPRIPAGAG